MGVSGEIMLGESRVFRCQGLVCERIFSARSMESWSIPIEGERRGMRRRASVIDDEQREKSKTVSESCLLLWVKSNERGN